MAMKLFLDMDGVLVNWFEGAHKIHGKPWSPGDDTPSGWRYTYGPEGWNFHDEEHFNVTYENLFNGMHREFWANLNWHADGPAILGMCEEAFPGDVVLLTAPHLQDGVMDGRLEWIERNAPEYKRKVLIGYCKDAIAAVGQENAILVDDWDRNINNWRKAGGMGLLCPRCWNSSYHWAHEPVKHMEKALKRRQ